MDSSWIHTIFTTSEMIQYICRNKGVSAFDSLTPHIKMFQDAVWHRGLCEQLGTNNRRACYVPGVDLELNAGAMAGRIAITVDLPKERFFTILGAENETPARFGFHGIRCTPLEVVEALAQITLAHLCGELIISEPFNKKAAVLHP